MKYQPIEAYDGQDKVKLLIKLYKETHNEKLKKEIFELSIPKLDNILKHFSNRNIDIIILKKLIIKYFFMSLEEYIKMNNIKIAFTSYIENFIKNNINEETRTRTNFIEINKLLDLFNIYRDEEYKNGIISLYSKRLEYIIKDYESELYSHEELYEIAVKALDYSIETFNSVYSPSFYIYSLRNINQSLKQYIETNKNELIMEERKWI